MKFCFCRALSLSDSSRFSLEFWPMFTFGSEEHSMSNSPGFSKFEISTPSDWLNHFFFFFFSQSEVLLSNFLEEWQIQEQCFCCYAIQRQASSMSTDHKLLLVFFFFPFIPVYDELGQQTPDFSKTPYASAPTQPKVNSKFWFLLIWIPISPISYAFMSIHLMNKCFAPSVCFSVRLFKKKTKQTTFSIGNNFWNDYWELWYFTCIFFLVRPFLSYQGKGYLARSDIRVTFFKKWLFGGQ